MSHNLGPIIPESQTVSDSTPLDFLPRPASEPVRFVILHFVDVTLEPGARLEVALGYDTDIFTDASGRDVWTRPINPRLGPIEIRVTGGSGSARLAEYGRAEPTTAGGISNPDVFVQDGVYQEPIYEARLNCSGLRDTAPVWTNTRELPPSSIEGQTAGAVGIVLSLDVDHVSSCTGTLIASDLILTSRHCFTDANGADVAVASVTFDYEVDDAGRAVPSYNPRFYKIRGEVLFGAAADGRNPSTAQDWVILQVDAPPGALPPPRPIRTAAPMDGERAFVVHHPNGATKKFQEITLGVFGRARDFDAAGGSSGSSVFDSAGQIVWGALSDGGCSGYTYADLNDIRTALRNPPPPPRPFDVVITFDKSGSMNQPAPPRGRTKLDEAKDAAALFVEMVRAAGGDQLGLVTFNDIADSTTPLRPVEIARDSLIGSAPPFSDGSVGAIGASGSTSMGDGIATALANFPAASSNRRAILLLSDGLENTAPFIRDVEAGLGDTVVCIVGFGSDADIDSRLLTRLAHDRNGVFTRAVDGLTLRKIFALCFGNLFGSGEILDPQYVLSASDRISDTIEFNVCGEETVTIVLGWDDVTSPLRLHLRTPEGKTIEACECATQSNGRSWAFLRLKLPCLGERDGRWTVQVDRVPVGGEFPPPPKDVRFFVSVVASGGPTIRVLNQQRRLYTGDEIAPLVAVQYANRTRPRARMTLTIDAPAAALGTLAAERGLVSARPGPDPVDAFRSTLQNIAEANGGELPVPRRTATVALHDDGLHGDGAMEPDGIFSESIADVTRHEGTYEFRAVASYGDGCVATREISWSMYVECGIDASTSEIVVSGPTVTSDGATSGTVAVFPRDLYGNAFGPGRGVLFDLTPGAGTTLDAEPRDRGDGWYDVELTWPSDGQPNVVIAQPDRRPVCLTPPAVPATPASPDDKSCQEPAAALLECLGLPEADVDSAQIKSVCVEIDMKKRC